MVTKYAPQHKVVDFSAQGCPIPENQSGEAADTFARIPPTRHNGQFEVESYACPDDIFTEVHQSDRWQVYVRQIRIF